MHHSVKLTMRPKAESLVDTIDTLSEADKNYSSMIQTVTSTANSRFHVQLQMRMDKYLIFILRLRFIHQAYILILS